MPVWAHIYIHKLYKSRGWGEFRGRCFPQISRRNAANANLSLSAPIINLRHPSCQPSRKVFLIGLNFSMAPRSSQLYFLAMTKPGINRRSLPSPGPRSGRTDAGKRRSVSLLMLNWLATSVDAGTGRYCMKNVLLSSQLPLATAMLNTVVHRSWGAGPPLKTCPLKNKSDWSARVWQAEEPQPTNPAYFTAFSRLSTRWMDVVLPNSLGWEWRKRSIWCPESV